METRTVKVKLDPVNIVTFCIIAFTAIVIIFGEIGMLFSGVENYGAAFVFTLPWAAGTLLCISLINYWQIIFQESSVVIRRFALWPIVLPYDSYLYQDETSYCFR